MSSFLLAWVLYWSCVHLMYLHGMHETSNHFKCVCCCCGVKLRVLQASCMCLQILTRAHFEIVAWRMQHASHVWHCLCSPLLTSAMP
jgi:hypothetical protein